MLNTARSVTHAFPSHSSLSSLFPSLSGARAALVVLLAALCAAAPARAQVNVQREVPATVTGRVTDGERGMPGVAVSLMANDSSRFKTLARARTDAEGRYRLSNVPPGRYQIMPFAPAYVVEGANTWPPGKPLNLAAGESVEGIDFHLERGGVITGRVTDADGNPVIAEPVLAVNLDEKIQNQRNGPFDPRDISTDDRGVYRLYGVPPGRYRVYVGQQSDEGGGRVSFGRRKLYRRTFYPNASEEAQAKVIEVMAGIEATDVDITLGRALKTYRASGRFVIAETGEPAPNVNFGYGVLDSAGRRMASYGGGMATTARGEFQTEGLAPGHYAVFAYQPQGGDDWYSDATTFEIADADVTGIVVKLRRGASVSGIVAVEGTSNRATIAGLLGQLKLYGYVEPTGEMLTAPNGSQSSINPDGSFRMGGLRPGKLRFGIGWPQAKGLTLSRVEQNGTTQRDGGDGGGIDVVEGAQLTGVRVVLAYGSAVVRGQVNLGGGTLPQGGRVIAFARRVGGGEERGARTVEVDARGRFVIDGLSAGEYVVQARVFVAGPGQIFQSDPQHVSLGEGGDTNITLALDLSAPYKGGQP
jgi:hypothetical protein